MRFEEKLFDLINSKKAIRYFLSGFLLFLFLDIISTLYILTFFPGTFEKNIIAAPLITKFGNLLGLIISFLFEVVILGIIFISFYVFLHMLRNISKNKIEKWPSVSRISLIIVLFIATVLYLNGVRNNLLLVVRRIFGF